MEELVSVIITAFNEEGKWLEESLNSLLNQTYRKLEIVVILDNPNNEVLKSIINSYEKKDRRVKFFLNERNIGLVQSLNKGLKLANGHYIARLDADDIAYSDRIEKQLNYMKSNNIDVLGALVDFIDETGNEIKIEYDLPYKFEDIKRIIKYRNPINHPTYFVRREVYIKTNGYRNIPYAEDYDFITRVISLGYKVENINEILVKYRKRQSSITNSNIINQRKMALYVIHMYKKRINGKKDGYSEETIRRRMEGNLFWKLYEFIQCKKNIEPKIKILNIINPYAYYFRIREEICKNKIKNMIS